MVAEFITITLDTDDGHPSDNGCAIAPSCITCPLPQCRYDVPSGLTRIKRMAVDEQVTELRRNGQSVRDISERVGIAVRTVQRSLRRNGL